MLHIPTLRPARRLALAGLVLALTLLPAAPLLAQGRERPWIGPRGERLGPRGDFVAAVGGALANPFAPPLVARPLLNGVYEMSLQDTGTGWVETFLVGIPSAPIAPGAPLLVVFHSYGRTPYEILLETTYFQEARARGWYVLAPLGAHKFNFAVPYAQENVRAAVTWALNGLPVDRERIYAVGFSMGGGGALNFAARYLDPAGPMVAAAVDHTGTVSIRDEYEHAFDTSLFDHPLMFGGSPASQPFAYQRSSTIDLDPLGAVDPQADLLRNLGHVPLRLWAVDLDPLAHLVHQTLRLDAHAPTAGVSTDLELAMGTHHSWDTLDVTAVLDWLEPHSLVLPGPGAAVDVLADRDGTWFHFALTQGAPGAFSPFRWLAEPGANRVVLDRIENVAGLRFHPVDLGLDPSQALVVELEASAGGGIEVTLEGMPAPPSAILRDGQVTSSWSHDAQTATLTLDEASPSVKRTWSIVP